MKLFGNSGTGSFVLGPDVAPGRYANEIAFLESTGSQYIDNVYTDNASANEVVFDFQVNGTGDIIGNKGSDIYANGTKIVGINSGVGAFAYYKPTNERVLLQLNSGENSLTNIVTTFSKTTSTFTIKADGETLSGAYSGIARNEPYTMLIRDSNQTVGFFVGKIYSGKIYEDGVLVRDFIPVEYNNIGYLYDKVSGEFFANQGTGKFVLGHRAPRFDGKACARSYTRRQLMMTSKPYNAEIDYLESTGTQWINTRIVPTLSTKVIVKVAFTQKTNAGYFGARDNDTLRFACATFTTGRYFAFSMNYNAWPKDRASLSLNTPFVLMAKNGQYSINNNTYSSAVVTDKIFNSAFLLFRYAAGNGSSLSYENSYMRLYFIEFYENDILTHSFIPVRIGNVGYMYDKVSKKLFGNAGTGSFILGHDK